MAYTTYDELLAENSALDEQFEADKIDEDKITGWIGKAENLVNHKCGQKYSVPFDPCPPIVVDLTKAIAVFYWLEDGATPPTTEEVFKIIKDRYLRALQMLDSISEGLEFIFNADGTEVVQNSAQSRLPTSNNTGVSPIFTMKDFTDSSVVVDENYP